MDLYDRVQADPSLIDKIENTKFANLGRGFSFHLNTPERDNFAGVPKREKLRALMEERYGIENIDSYFLPIGVTNMTYRGITGVSEPDLFKDLGKYRDKLSMTNAHVKRHGEFYVAYFPPAMVEDTNIEHEAVHAFIYHNNRHYALLDSSLSSINIQKTNEKEHSWMEAIAWVATRENYNMDHILNHYVSSFSDGTWKTFRRNLLIITSSAIKETASRTRDKVSAGDYQDIPDIVRGMATAFYVRVHDISRSREEAITQWKKSFELARQLKEKLGVKEFLRLAAEKHQDELGDLVC